MVKQCAVIFGCLAVGEFIVWLTGISIPGSILGMLLLTMLLDRNIVSAEKIGPMCRFLVSNMGFFFVPPGVALMLYFDIIAASWLPITVATLVSTALVLVVTGQVHQYFRHAIHKK
ncbi:MAG: CidA/LrgA family protein [Duncaniella sp.]|nr:CidA/LrgA family protein [Duncaniella sp.]MDE6327693.1 CidA/LrgA family protein [Duncaniella sp.]MDE6465430.1 CidA/LrgA family protein [Duncaniella sp.]MDE6765481.1 CidA/LrgA family protein [Duncaniella sp.]